MIIHWNCGYPIFSQDHIYRTTHKILWMKNTYHVGVSIGWHSGVSWDANGVKWDATNVIIRGFLLRWDISKHGYAGWKNMVNLFAEPLLSDKTIPYLTLGERGSLYACMILSHLQVKVSRFYQSYFLLPSFLSPSPNRKLLDLSQTPERRSDRMPESMSK